MIKNIMILICGALLGALILLEYVLGQPRIVITKEVPVYEYEKTIRGEFKEEAVCIEGSFIPGETYEVSFSVKHLREGGSEMHSIFMEKNRD